MPGIGYPGKRKKSLWRQAQRLRTNKFPTLIIAQGERENKMVYRIENRMVVDSQWPEPVQEPEEKLKGPGWEEIGTGVFVLEEDAYGYAKESLARDGDLRQEFVEWFYSGNWIREDGIGTD